MCLQVLTFGQAYRISLLMEMPDSPVNQAVGMFMIRTTFYSQDGGQVISSAQPVRNTDVCYPLVKCGSKLLLLCFDSLHSLLCAPQAGQVLSATSSRFVSAPATV